VCRRNHVGWGCRVTQLCHGRFEPTVVLHTGAKCVAVQKRSRWCVRRLHRCSLHNLTSCHRGQIHRQLLAGFDGSNRGAWRSRVAWSKSVVHDDLDGPPSAAKKPVRIRCLLGLPSVAGEPGFEPRQTESESVVLPLHHSPMRLPSKINALWMALDFRQTAGRRQANHPGANVATLYPQATSLASIRNAVLSRCSRQRSLPFLAVTFEHVQPCAPKKKPKTGREDADRDYVSEAFR
jgi:hypothetical protein